ncbi:MAG: hypothetical protein ACMXYE_00615 [Candidatus Woesearchaeota archaeon]
MDLFAQKNNQPDPKAQQSGGFFGGGQKQPPANAQTQQQTDDIQVLMRKLRIHEERVLNLRKKLQMVEHNMLHNQKKVVGEIKFMVQEISDTKREFAGLKTHLREFSRELMNAAKKEDIQILERYVSMWEPVKFITREEVERIVEEKVAEQIHALKSKK